MYVCCFKNFIENMIVVRFKIIRWPRPGPPVHRLQNKWGLEYGLPSTHAMVSLAMPFSVVIFMYDR